MSVSDRLLEKGGSVRVLFTTQVGAGHWRPLAPFALALQSAGHDIAFATTPFGCTDLPNHGFRCFPAGIDDWRKQPQLSTMNAVQTAGPAQAEAVWANVFVDIRAAQAIPDLFAICKEWPPDLIVREMTEFGGCIVAERLGLPHATVQVGAFRPGLQQSIAAALNRQRSAVGLPPDDELAMLYRYLLLSPVPPSFQEPGRPLPPTAHAVRWESFDLGHPGDNIRPAWVEDLPEQPTIYATLGTAYNRTPGIFQTILAGLRDEPVNLIVTLGPNLDPADYGPQPPQVRIARYIPQSLILPYCTLVITHGGFGSTMTTLRHGLPLVMLPIAADMPDNARRCAALGVAQVLDSGQRTPEAIRVAVQTVLHRPEFRRNAAQLQAEMLALPGPAQAVPLLERLAADKRPILTWDTAL